MFHRSVLLLAAAAALFTTGCHSDPPCKGTSVVCGGACVDLQADGRNCGACGNACAAGTACAAGRCVMSCPAGSPDLCGAGDGARCTRLAVDPQNCGTCGRTCAAGTACAAGECVTSCPAGSPDVCGVADAAFCTTLAEDARNCGACGNACPVGAACVAGQCVTTCPDGQAPYQGRCIELVSPSSCTDGDVYRRPCGMCGVTTRTCVGNAWGDWSACTGEGACATGSTSMEACGSKIGACKQGTRTRSCTASCTWGAWGACTGEVRPTPEVCDNGVDENCNGVADEGCGCKAVAPGAGGALAVTGPIAKLVADPVRCLVYGLRAGTPGEVVVFDTAQKAELGRIALPQAATDLAISPSGARLLAAHDTAHQVSVIDRGLLAVTATVPVASDPYAIELDDAGHAYYAQLNQWCGVRSFDPAVGTSSDKVLSCQDAPDLELSRDGKYLFAGESGTSATNLTRYRVEGGALVAEGETPWNSGNGFLFPERQLFLSPGGQHIYYAGYQLDPMHLASVNGRTGERVFAEDRAGTFAVGQTTVWDAALVRPVAKLPATISAAALAAGDTELWTWDASSARMSYVNVADLLGSTVLGERYVPPAPLSTYTLTRLVADPVRPRLYGLDSTHGLVVAIDTATLTPTGALVVGSSPSDLAIAPSGSALYVGDLQTTALARIDLASFRVDRLISTPDVPYEVEVLTSGRVATIDEDQWTSLSVIDENTGAVLYHGPADYFAGALAATPDGAALFVAESGLSRSHIFRFDVTGATPKQVATSDYSITSGFSSPARSVVPSPDGRAVYYAGYVLDGTNLTGLLYPQVDAIRTISADGALATSSTKVYRLADGLVLGTLPVSGAIQAAGPDGKTVYVYTTTGITKVDLSAY